MISDLHKVIDNLPSINNFEKAILKQMDMIKLRDYANENTTEQLSKDIYYEEFYNLFYLAQYEYDVLKYGKKAILLSVAYEGINYKEEDIYENPTQHYAGRQFQDDN